MSTDRRLRFAHRFKSGALCEFEIDLEAVRDNSFTPHFRWNGRKHKVREFISWVLSAFATVADRAGVPVIWCFVHQGNGATETWLFEPGEKPRRIAKAQEPSCNPASAIMVATTAKFATQEEVL
jgi:hypothetical protein